MLLRRSNPRLRQRPMVRAGWVLALAVGAAISAGAAGVEPMPNRVCSFHLGNSLTDTVDGWLAPLAAEAGLPLACHRFTMPGASTDWLWTHPGTGFGDSEYRDAFRRLAPISHLVLQPFAGHNRSVAEEAAAIGRFYRLCRQSSPGVRLWLYQPWPALDFPEPWSRGIYPLGRAEDLRVPELDLEPDEILERGSDGRRQLRRRSAPEGWAAAARNHGRYFELLRRELAARFPEARVGLIPGGPALALLKEYIDAGLIPGIKDFEAVCFADDRHLKPAGRYLISLVHLACFLGESPVGRVSAGASGLTANQAHWWQRVAWAAVRQCRWSGVHPEAASPAWRYTEAPTDSMPQRVFQWRQMEAFVKALEAAGPASPPPSSPCHPTRPERSAGLLDRFRRRIGFPPPGFLPEVPPARLERTGADDQAVYYRCRVQVTPEMNVYGLYIVPRAAEGPPPLLIAQHGGGGFPELAAFGRHSNYHDMIPGAVARGWAVFAPHLVFYPFHDREVGTPIPEGVRMGLDQRLRRLGTTLAAVEVEAIRFALTALQRRPELDPDRVAMTGLSYGGYYTLYTAALDQRIGAAAISCAFADWGSPPHEIDAPDRWDARGRLNDLSSAELAALICPRPLLVEAGRRDPLFPLPASLEMAHAAAEVYERRGAVDQFAFVGFDGGHEFVGGPVWGFLERWRRCGPFHSGNCTSNR